MASFRISHGKIAMPYKVVIYGPEGIGKSTFASQFPNPIFSDTEGSTQRMDVARFDPPPNTWAMLTQQAEFVRDNPAICETYIIDTADWAERFCQRVICDRSHKEGIEDFGYGKGYTYVAEEFGKLVNILNEILGRGIHVVITAHAAMRKFEQPDEMGAYDRWEMKMHKLISSMLKEWADMVLFVNYKTYVVKTDTNKNKVQGGRRVIYTTHMNCWDAKNRDGLPDELPFEYSSIAHLFGAPEPRTEQSENVSDVMPSTPPDISNEAQNDPYAGIPEALRKLMIASNVLPEELMYIANEQKGYYPKGTPISNYADDFIQGWCIGMWSQVLNAIEINRIQTPF